MTIKIGFVMDPIETVKPHKDTTFAMMLEAQKRQWSIYSITQPDLYIENADPRASAKIITVADTTNYYHEQDQLDISLTELDIIIMRKDPPFDNEYLYATYILELAEKKQVLVLNKPQSLRDFNEKIAVNWFPQCCVPSMVTSNPTQIKSFIKKHHDIILKPLDKMGGQEIFRITEQDKNTNVIIESITRNASQKIMIQQYIPKILDGDKRILIINGKPVPYAYARIPASGETRANLATGGRGIGVKLTERDQWICQQLGDTLKTKGLIFVGIDVIGDYLTEINVTSPTCARELDALYDINICGDFMDSIEQSLQQLSVNK
ncbi:MAG: glutathione synthase [Methylococcales bacterium]|jgi:glutathione synthase|nr:glutathione synthase [Methylococcales bacterium]MBT7411015.1 glutathione synthase [Methylococcales bacterium]